MTSPLVVLIGPSGVGKTKTAKRLAAALGVESVDTDAIVVKSYGPIERIFQLDGEARFREYERVAVEQALCTSGVVAVGAGAIADDQTRRQLASCRVALLTMNEDVAKARMESLTDRPLLQGDGIAHWTQLTNARMPWYREVADIEIEVNHRPMSEVVEQLLHWLDSDVAKPNSEEQDVDH